MVHVQRPNGAGAKLRVRQSAGRAHGYAVPARDAVHVFRDPRRRALVRLLQLRVYAGLNTETTLPADILVNMRLLRPESELYPSACLKSSVNKRVLHCFYSAH